MSRQRAASIRPESQEIGRSEKRALWMLIAGAAIVRIVYAIPEIPDGLFDDGYITFRYALNFARGLGFVFNPGERVLGTTSPLFTFLLAATGRVVGLSHLETIAVTADILAALGMLYYSERVLSAVDLNVEVKWTYLTILAFLPSFISNGTSGMETPVVLFLMALSLFLCIQNRMMALAVVGVLLFLCRIDTGIWLLAIGIHILMTNRGRSIRDLVAPLILFLAGISASLVVAKVYFGSVIPQSIVGKAVSHGAFERPDWRYVLQFLSAFMPAQRFGVFGLALIAAIFLAMLPVASQISRQHPGLRPVLYFIPLYIGIFLASRSPLFSWYLMPPKWAFYLLATYSIWFLVRWVLNQLALPLKPAQAMVVLGALIVATGIVNVRASIVNRSPNTWVTISEMIEQNVRPDGRVFLEHIGLVGFKTGRYIYDYMGLVTPETTRLKRLYGPAWLTKASREFNADAVILYGADIPVVDATDDTDAAWFQSSYRHIQDYDAPGLTISVFFKLDGDRSNAAVSLLTQKPIPAHFTDVK